MKGVKTSWTDSMSKKSWPNLFSNLLYKMSQDILDRQYVQDVLAQLI